MSSTGQQSSSRHVEKAPAKHLTLLQEKESENADLRRQVRDLQQDRNKDLTRIEEFEKEHKAQLKTIDRLQKENSIYKKYDVEREDLFEEIRVADRRQRLELADARNMTNEISSSVPLSASTKAESKEQANPSQFKHSSSDTLAKELESEKVLTVLSNATDNETLRGKIKTEIIPAQVATRSPGGSISSSDKEDEQKPNASVQTGFAAATSQTRGKYWPRGVL